MNFDNALDLYQQRYRDRTDSFAPQFTRDVTFQVTEACNLRCTYCLAKDTMISMADGTLKPIQDIQIGDKVLGFDEALTNLTLFETTVEKVFQHTKQPDEVVYDVEQSTNDRRLQITGNHKIVVYDDGAYIFMPIENIKTGNIIPKPWHDNNAKILKKEIIEDFEGELYNLQTISRTYIADNVLVHNCYQTNKSPKVMSWDTAKVCVDLLFHMWEEDEPDGFINKKTEFVILDFIGGEPMLQVELIDKICTYFMERALAEIPIWAERFMISMASNGTIYFTPEVQNFIKKWEHRLSYSVSIDGPKEMHDACRIFPDGSGSFDMAKAAQDHYNSTHYTPMGTKATVSWDNMPYLDKTIQYFIDQGYKNIHANTIYEEDWTPEQGQFYYKKLKEVADILLKHNGEIGIALFDERFFHPRDDMQQTWCGGYDSMLAFDTEGNAYPCIRYMDSSLNGQAKPVIIGNAWDGLYKTEEQKYCHDCLACITWYSQNDDECRNCPIAQGCADCAAESYQKFGQFNKRHKLGSCWVHRARSLANVYYWNKLYRQQGKTQRFKRFLPDDLALQLISPEELEMLNALEREE